MIRVRFGGRYPGCREGGAMEGYLSLNDVAKRANMSARHIRKHLSEIPHYRFSKHGKIWIDWIEFQAWMQRRRVEIRQDEQVVEILRDLAQMGAVS